MTQLTNFGDKRQVQHCLYCGGNIDTREHVPPKVFLDTPYPDDLPIVNACKECNQGYSLDEEYVACLIECAKVGSVDTNLIGRTKICRILSKKPALLKKLRAARMILHGRTAFSVEQKRFHNVMLKLAQGHMMFDQNEPVFGIEEPVSFGYGILEDLDDEGRESFENSVEVSLLPEVGSRAMQRIVMSGGQPTSYWVEIQPGLYRYMTPSPGTIRIVLSEYIWVESVWQ